MSSPPQSGSMEKKSDGYCSELERGSLVARIAQGEVEEVTSYSINRSIEATAFPLLKGTGPGPYMTQGHLGLV
jgi:hypothetical protein